MKVDWLKYKEKNHVAAWFLSRAVSEIGLDQFGEFDSSELDVKFSVNGIDVPFITVFDALEDHVSDKENIIHENARLSSSKIVYDEIEKLKASVGALNKLISGADTY